MVASRSLGKLRGVPEEDLRAIDQLHMAADKFILAGLNGEAQDGAVLMALESVDFVLQDLWKFSRDATYHTYGNLYKFRKEWHGRKFKCIRTGDVVTIDATTLKETDCVPVGEGFVDVGRYGAYHRTVGCGEITE